MAITQRQQKIAEGVPASACWNCKASVQGAHFCATCGKIQPVVTGADYFTFLELPRKLTIDPAALEGKFHTLSWKLHPDNFVRASEFERNVSLERSSELNDAFRTLRDPIGRISYLLEFLGVRKEGTTKQQAPPELLEEVFELNESLDELRDARSKRRRHRGFARTPHWRAEEFSKAPRRSGRKPRDRRARMGRCSRRKRRRSRPHRDSRSHGRPAQSPRVHSQSR